MRKSAVHQFIAH